MTKEKLEKEVTRLKEENELLRAEVEAVRSKKTVLLAGVRKMINALEGMNAELGSLEGTEKDGG